MTDTNPKSFEKHKFINLMNDLTRGNIGWPSHWGLFGKHSVPGKRDGILLTACRVVESGGEFPIQGYKWSLTIRHLKKGKLRPRTLLAFWGEDSDLKEVATMDNILVGERDVPQLAIVDDTWRLVYPNLNSRIRRKVENELFKILSKISESDEKILLSSSKIPEACFLGR